MAPEDRIVPTTPNTEPVISDTRASFTLRGTRAVGTTTRNVTASTPDTADRPGCLLLSQLGHLRYADTSHTTPLLSHRSNDLIGFLIWNKATCVLVIDVAVWSP